MPLNTLSDVSTLPVPLSAGEAAVSVEAVQGDVLRLFDEYAPGLRRYLRSCGLAPEAADDIVQEAFLVLFRHLLRGGGRQNLRGWLFQVGHRHANKHHQKRRRWQRDQAPWDPRLAEGVVDPAANPEMATIARERNRRLRAVLSALPERDRHCFYLRAEGLRYRQIASVLGMSLGAVAKSLTRGLARLSIVVKE